MEVIDQAAELTKPVGSGATIRNREQRGLGGLSISIPTEDTRDDDYEPEPSSPGTPEAMVSPWQADSAEAMK